MAEKLRSPGLLRAALLASTALLSPVVLGLAPAAQAQSPTGGNVVAGSARITQGGTATTIDQSSARAVVNWQQFNVGAGSSVQFNQPNAQAWTLNRVVGSDPSVIAGRITANGGIAIVNQSGVTFTQGAQVNVGSLIASAANVTNDNFMAGRMVFDGPPRPGARVENQGSITIADRGLAALVGPRVANSGTINARLGRVALAGAETYRLDLSGDGLIGIDVTQAVRTAPDGGAAIVTNSGTINAQGGSVLLTAHAASGLVEDLVRQTGSGRIAVGSGQAALRAEGGNVRVEGQVTARGGRNRRGGSIEVLASEGVTIAQGSVVDASGGAGGGRVAIGTDAASAPGRPGRLSRSVRVEQGAVVRADARGRRGAAASGDGGVVIINSSERTVVRGDLSARGGANGGDGGLVEVSSSGLLTLDMGRVDVRAPAGSNGTLLLDPVNILVTTASPQPGLETGGTLTGGGYTTDGANGAPFTAVITPADIAAFAGTVSLQAHDTLTIASAVTKTNGGLTLITTDAGGGGIIVNAGATITLSNGGGAAALAMNSAAGVTLNAGISATSIGITAGAGNIALQAGSSLAATTGGVTLQASGTVTQVAGTSIAAAAASSIQGSALTLGTVTIQDAGNVPQALQLTATGGGIGQLASTGITAATLTVSATGAVTLSESGNAFTGFAGTARADSVVRSGSALTLGTVTVRDAGNVTHDLSITSGGAIGQTATTAITATTVTANATGAVTLGESGNAFTGFIGTATADSAVRSGSALTLGAVTVRDAGNVAHNVSITSGGAIGQTATTAITAATVTANATGAVTLTESGNAFTGFAGTATADSTVRSGNALTLGTVTVRDAGNVAHDLSLTAGGGIGQTGSTAITAATITVAASGAVTLGESGNAFTGFTGSATADSSIRSGSALTLGNLTVRDAGNVVHDLGITAGGGISQAASTAITAAAVTANATGAVTLAESGNAFTGFAGTATADSTVRSGNALTLGTIIVRDAGNVAHDLSLTAGGAIGQTASTAVTAATVTATAAGTLTLNQSGNAFTGFAGSASGNASIASGSALTIGAFSDTANNAVVSISGAGLTAAGALSVSGTGASLALQSSLGVSQSGGSITVAALTGAATGGSFTLGQTGNLITAVGAGGISATGSVTLVNNAGLSVGGLVSAGTGNAVALTARSGTLATTAALQATNGSITLIADAITLGAAVQAGTGTVTLRPFTGSRGILLGGTDATRLALTTASLGQVSAGTLQVGTTTGAISIGSALDLTGKAGTLHLLGGSVAQSAALTVGSVTGAASSGSFTLGDAGNAIGAIGAAGITAHGNVTVATTSGLTVNGAVTAGNGDTITLTAAGGTLATAAGGALQASDGTITLVADAMTLGAAVDAGGTSGDGTVVLRPVTASRGILLGGTDAAQLALTTASLGQVATDTLRIGTTTGAITLGSALDLSANANTLVLQGGSVAQAAGAYLTVGAVGGAASSGNFALNAISGAVTNAIDEISGITATGNISVFSENALAINGAVQSSGPGSIALASGGSLSVDASVRAGTRPASGAGSGTVQLWGKGIALTAAVQAGDLVTLVGAGSLTAAPAAAVAGTGITQNASGLITAQRLVAIGGGSISLGQANTVDAANLATFGSGVTFRSGVALALSGNLASPAVPAGGTTANAAAVLATTGNIAITGAAGVTISNGVTASAGSVTATAAGTLQVDAAVTATTTASLTASGSAHLIALGTGGSVTAPTVTLVADRMDLGASGTTIAGSTAVLLRQNTNGMALQLGGTDPGGLLYLASADRVSAGRLTLGNGNTGDITLNSGITTATTVELLSGGSITQAAGVGITAANLTATASGDIRLVGTGNTFGTIVGSAADATTGLDAGGDLRITTAAAGGLSLPVLARFGTTSGKVARIEADDLVIDTTNGGIRSGATGNMVAILPHTAAHGITLGGTVAGTLSLTDAELGRIGAGGTALDRLRIGSDAAGAIGITGAISIGATQAQVLELRSGGGITQAAAGTITATDFAARAGTSITLDQANAITRVVATTADAGPAGSYATRTRGLETDNGSIALNSTGALTIAADVVANGATTLDLAGVSLTSGGALSLAAGVLVQAGQGDAVLTATGTLTTGTGAVVAAGDAYTVAHEADVPADARAIYGDVRLQAAGFSLANGSLDAGAARNGRDVVVTQTSGAFGFSLSALAHAPRRDLILAAQTGILTLTGTGSAGRDITASGQAGITAALGSSIAAGRDISLRAVAGGLSMPVPGVGDPAAAVVNAGRDLTLRAGNGFQMGGSLTAGRTMALTADAGSMALQGSLVARGAGGGVVLHADGAAADIQQNAGSIDTLKLSGSAARDITLARPANAIDALDGLAAGRDLTVVSSSATLAVTNAVSAGTGRTLALFADDLALSAALQVPGGVLQIAPLTTTRGIVLGGAGGATNAGSLTFDTAELALLPNGAGAHAAELRLGSTGGGGIALAGAVDLADAATGLNPRADLLTLLSGAGVAQQAGSRLVVPALAVAAGGTVALDPGAAGNRIDTLSGLVAGGDVSLRSGAPGLTVNGGIRTGAGGALTLRADALVLNGGLNVGAGGSITLLPDSSRGVTLGGTAAGTLSLDAAALQRLGGATSFSVQGSSGTAAQADYALLRIGGTAATTTASGISLAGAVTLDGSNGFAAPVRLDLRSSGSVDGNGGALRAAALTATVGGDVLLGNAANRIATLETITAGSGRAIQLAVQGDLALQAALTAAGGSLSLSATGAITQTAGGTFNTGTLQLNSGGAVTLDQANYFTLLGASNIGGAGSLHSTGNLAVAGAISTPGALSLRADGLLAVNAGSSLAAASLQLTGSSLRVSGSATASGSMVLQGGNVTTDAGSSLSAASLQVTGAGLRLGGNATASGSLTVQGNEVTTDAGGSLAGNAVRVSAAGQLRLGGGMVAEQARLSGGSVVLDGARFTIGTAMLVSSTGGIGAGAASTVAPLRGSQLPAVVIDTRGGVTVDPLSIVRPDTPGLLPDAQPTQMRIAGFDLPGAFGVPSSAAGGTAQLNLRAGNSAVFLLLDGGSATGRVEAGRLGIHGTGGSVELQGVLNDVAGPGAARFSDISRPNALAALQRYRFNGCVVNSVGCIVVPAQQPVVQRPVLVPLFNLLFSRADMDEVTIPNVAETDYE